MFKDKNLFKIDETLIGNAMDAKVFRFFNQNVAASEFLHYVVCIIYFCILCSLNQKKLFLILYTEKYLKIILLFYR